MLAEKQMELNLPCGPWNLLASAQWHDHPVSIYKNAEGLLLMVLFEEEAGKVKGLLVLLKKPFLLKSEPAGPAKSIDTVIKKNVAGKWLSFALVDAKPAYIEYSQQAMFDAVRAQYNELVGLEKPAGVNAVPLTKAGADAQEALFGDPFLLLAFSPPKPVQPLPTGLPIGFTADKKKVSLALASKTVVCGNSMESRLKALLVLAENALFQGIPCVVFDSTTRLSPLLSLKNTEVKALKELDLHAPSFPEPKKVLLGKDFFADLSFVSPSFFVEAIGFSDDVKTLLVSRGKLPPALQDLVSGLEKTPETREAPRWLLQKAVRALRVLQKQCGPVFNKNASLDFLDAAPARGSSKLCFVDLSAQPLEARTLALYSLLAQAPSGQPSTTEPRALDALFVITEDAQGFALQLQALINKLPENIGLALNASHAVDASFLSGATRVELLNEKEAVLTQGEQKTRFFLRDPLPQKTQKTPASKLTATENALKPVRS